MVRAPMASTYQAPAVCIDLNQYARPHVRFGSKADIRQRQADVRFTPKSGHSNHLFQGASVAPVVARWINQREHERHSRAIRPLGDCLTP